MNDSISNRRLRRLIHNKASYAFVNLSQTVQKSENKKKKEENIDKLNSFYDLV
jgi:hypothetical protein